MFQKESENQEQLFQSSSRIPNKTKICYFVILAAVEFVLAFSAFGFINFYPVAITTLHIPVLLGAFFLGKWGGAGMGGVFGFISMWKASNVSFTAADAMFSPFTSPDPWGSIIVSLGMRILFGFCSGLIYGQIKKVQHFWPALILATFFCTYLHSFFVLSAMNLFFPSEGMNPLTISFKGFSVMATAAVVVCFICYIDKFTTIGSKMRNSMEKIEKYAFTTENLMWMGIFLGIMFVVSSSLVIQFLDRIDFLLNEYGYGVDMRLKGIMEGWGIQFVVSATAVAFLLFWIFTYFNEISADAINRSQIDSLTKLYNKDAVRQKIDSILMGRANPLGALIMLDIDRFKEINVRFGDSVGDAMLCKIAECLRLHSEETDIPGRLGGDEFCIYIDGYISQEDLERRVYDVFMDLKKIGLPDGSTVSCSVGVTKGTTLDGFQQFYKEADNALYLSKNNGRGRFSFYER